jgi:hypothetical protein
MFSDALHTRRRPQPVALALALLGAGVGLGCEAPARTEPTRVSVAAPTRDVRGDRRAVQAAVAALIPGDTLYFAAGTYRVGGGLVVSVPDVVLQGDTEGTVLEGCSPTAVQAMGEDAFFAECAGLVLTGARQQVRGLTFTRFSTALVLAGGRDSAGPVAQTVGGQRVEGNTFRESSSVEVWSDTNAPTVIRNNRFVHLHHPLQLLGRGIEVRDNRIESIDDTRVPYASPGSAITMRPLRNGRCGDVAIVGNTLRGHADGVVLMIAPDDVAGAHCTRVTVDDNTITLSATRRGVGVRVANLQRALQEGWLDLPAPAEGWPTGFANARVDSVRVARNQVDGAVGVAVELLFASGAEVAENRIATVAPLAATERDALVRSGTLGDGAGLWLLSPMWRTTNGQAVWQWPVAVTPPR